MNERLEVKEPNAGVEVHGPFIEEWRVTINGYRIPYLHVRELQDGRIDPVIDHRFCLPEAVPREEFDRWAPILANAMAVAAGYSCHGENCQPVNPFTVRMRQLGGAPEAPTLKLVE